MKLGNMGEQTRAAIKNPQMQITRAHELNASRMELDTLAGELQASRAYRY